MTDTIKFKNLPDSMKPYEKFKKYGEERLSDAELLAIILRTGTKEVNIIDVAQNLLNIASRNLMNLHELSYKELQKITGIGEVKAMQLKCIAEISNRIATTKHDAKICFTSAKSIADYFMEELRHKQQEVLIVCMFNSKCELLGDVTISKGSVNSSMVPPREIFLYALEKKAVHIILVHNHPSGSCSPSREDDVVTERIMECGRILGIPLSDHIIIGDLDYYSYREAGIIT